jgi:hypothetical protein
MPKIRRSLTTTTAASWSDGKCQPGAYQCRGKARDEKKLLHGCIPFSRG